MRLMRFARVAAFGLLVSLALAACAPIDTRPSATETAAAQDAATLARQGQLDAAAQAWAALAPNAGARADHYRLLAAEAWRHAGELDHATATLAQIDRRNLSDDEPLRLDLLRAESALATHDIPTALRLTTQPNVPVPDALRPRLLELRARAMAASGDYWGAARTRAEMHEQLSGFCNNAPPPCVRATACCRGSRKR